MSAYDSPEHAAFTAALRTWTAKLHEHIVTTTRAAYPTAASLKVAINYTEDGESVYLDEVLDADGEPLSTPNTPAWDTLLDELWQPLNDLHDLDHPVAIFDTDDTGEYDLGSTP